MVPWHTMMKCSRDGNAVCAGTRGTAPRLQQVTTVALMPGAVATYLGVEVLRRHATGIPLPEARFLELWKAAVPSGVAVSMDLVKVRTVARMREWGRPAVASGFMFPFTRWH